MSWTNNADFNDRRQFHISHGYGPDGRCVIQIVFPDGVDEESVIELNNDIKEAIIDGFETRAIDDLPIPDVFTKIDNMIQANKKTLDT